MNGYDVVAKILKAEGVEFLSAFPMQPLIDACAKIGIRPIICRQERAGVNIADGYSRTLNGRKFGVFSMQNGPGAENCFAGSPGVCRFGSHADPPRGRAVVSTRHCTSN